MTEIEQLDNECMRAINESRTTPGLDSIIDGVLRESKNTVTSSEALLEEGRAILDGKPNSGADSALLAEAYAILGIPPGETTSGKKTDEQLHSEACAFIK